MRQKLKNMLGEERGVLVLEIRERLAITQKRMREKLNMGERSYSETFRQTWEVLTA